jgi:predicted MFS family arabinose efflux permease
MTKHRRFGRRIPAARIAVAIGFMLSGVAFASWVVRIPDVQSRLGLSESGLGLVLLGVAVGGLLALPLSGVLIGRFGSQSVARAAGLCLAASVAVPAQVATPWLLTLILVVLGGATSIFSVALNTQAAALERRMKRPIMAGLHALYSVGGLVGAAVGGIIAGAGISANAHLGAAAVVVAVVSLTTSRALLRPEIDGAIGGRAFARPSRPLLLLGLVAFCVLFGEGAVADWSAVYLRDVGRAGPALAAAGYAAFSLMMAAGRFVGDALTVCLGPAWLVRLGGSSAAVGIALAVGQGNPWITVLGFGAVGAGLSTIFPTMLAAAGRVPGTAPSTAIAAISSVGYVGFLAGPPLIGLVAEASSLRVGVGLVGLTSLLIIALSGVLPARSTFGARRRTPSLARLDAARLSDA